MAGCDRDAVKGLPDADPASGRLTRWCPSAENLRVQQRRSRAGWDDLLQRFKSALELEH